MAERFLAGWTYASGPKVLVKKTNPSLVEWEKLDEENREKDRAAVRSVPRLLDLIGETIYR
jgi:hypothetical protein